jgi:hypothetical protein
VRNLGGHPGFTKKSLAVCFEVLKLGLQGFHDHSATEIFILAGSQHSFTALSQRLKVSVPHETIADVPRQVTVGLGRNETGSGGIAHPHTFSKAYCVENPGIAVDVCNESPADCREGHGFERNSGIRAVNGREVSAFTVAAPNFLPQCSLSDSPYVCHIALLFVC